LRNNKFTKKNHLNNTYIHIGVPKAGSSYLQKYLELRTEIYHNWMDLADYPLHHIIDEEITEKGIDSIRVFSQESLSTPLVALDRIKLAPQIEKIKSARYDVALKLKSMFPDAEILLVLRNYKDIIPSIYSELLVMGLTLDKGQFLKKFGVFILELYHYEQIIQTYEEVFGKEKLTIVPFEMLKEDADTFQKFLANYFRIDHHKVIIDRENKGIGNQMVLRVRFRNKIRAVILPLLPAKYRFTFSEYWRNKNIQLKNKIWSVNSEGIDFSNVTGFEELVKKFKDKNSHVPFLESFHKYEQYY
jgi:hypothetical protein